MKAIIVVSILIGYSTICFAQRTETIRLWDRKAPFTTIQVEEDIYNERNYVQTVAHPEVTVYFPNENTANGRALLVIPGGGYANLAFNHEGNHIGKFYSEHGYVVAVLKYRLPDPSYMDEPWIVPLTDAQQAIKVIRRNAENWKIDPEKVGVVGFSAGGHLASSLAVHGSKEEGTHPNFNILIYPVITMDDGLAHQGSRTRLLRSKLGSEWEVFHSNEKHVNASTPPAFMVHSWDDQSVVVENSIIYAKALASHGTKVELHLFEKGGHGFGMGKADVHGTVAQWPKLSLAWMEEFFKTN
ncbi:alpha/beta hydrolase [Mongoliitalea lutea]|uniref:Endo-1,4-beta-xylanase n=1 Tax=Mongoliitalea lutea TaxID=849756 RepID=A0A8J3CXP8_9BACT|nr:alpha/beta hydrolase [Mongoliitalea lutea]GHB38912.1 endo-1,4-beta-xylanase [Mongoliitalea lutea]